MKQFRFALLHFLIIVDTINRMDIDKASLHVLIFAERNERIRPISLRKAQKSEENYYVKQKRY